MDRQQKTYFYGETMKDRTNDLDFKKLTEDFMEKRNNEETKKTLDYARALLAIDLEIKGLKDDQKEIKSEAKSEGVQVQKVTKALNALKAAMKSNDTDLIELELIGELLDKDVDIKTMLSELTKKD